MATPVLRGTPLPQLQNYVEHYDPENGWTKEYEWEGIQPAWVAQYASLFQAAGCATNLSVKFGVGRLIVNDTTGAVTIDRWEVGAEQNAKSILQNPLLLSTVGEEDLLAIAGVELGETDYATLRAQFVLAGGKEVAIRQLDQMRLGSTDYEDDDYVLRHTTNVSNRYTSNISDVNKGCIYTFAQLFTEVQSPISWVYPLPGRLVYKLQAIVAPDVRDGFLWGWKKSASTEQSAASNRVNIATLYKLDQWSTDRYSTV